MAIVITQKWTATRMIITVWADMLAEDLIVMTTKRRMNRRRKMTSTKIQL